MSIFRKVKKFLGKNADELATVASVLRTVTSALPIGRGDKDKISDALSKIEKAAGNIAQSSAAMSGEPTAEDKEAIKAIVEQVLKDSKNKSWLAGLLKGN
jgi:hypothetical protein